MRAPQAQAEAVQPVQVPQVQAEAVQLLLLVQGLLALLVDLRLSFVASVWALRDGVSHHRRKDYR